MLAALEDLLLHKRVLKIATVQICSIACTLLKTMVQSGEEAASGVLFQCTNVCHGYACMLS